MTTRRKRSAKSPRIEALIGEDRELFKGLLKESLQEVLEAEMTETVGAGLGERTAVRTGYRSGYYSRGLVTRVGKLELRVPRDREGRFSTELFDRFQRSEKALVSALAEMYVQGVSTRKVKAVTEELCGHTFSASTVSRINKSLDGLLRRFAQRRLDEAYPYLILDARYEKVRLDGVIQSQAVFIAIGINGEGRRQILGVELSNRESRSSWTTFVTSLKTRGLHGVEFVVSDDHAELKRAVRELLPEAVWQRCYVHFLRNALDYLPRKADDDCRQELRWLLAAVPHASRRCAARSPGTHLADRADREREGGGATDAHRAAARRRLDGICADLLRRALSQHGLRQARHRDRPERTGATGLALSGRLGRSRSGDAGRDPLRRHDRTGVPWASPLGRGGRTHRPCLRRVYRR